MRFFLRKPKFPILIDTGEALVGVTTSGELDMRLEKVGLAGNESRSVIDATAEGFALYPEQMAISPLTLKKRWTKAEIIELYNRKKGQGLPEYLPASLGNKSVQRIVHDLCKLLAGPKNPL